MGALSLFLAAAGCDTGGVEGHVAHPCPPGSCCAGMCCAQPAIGTDAATLPAKPNAPGASGSAATVLAISKLYFGDTDRSGRASSSAWQTYGLNIDGKVTGWDATNVCTLASGASVCTQVDGKGGVDNSFGENIVPIILTLDDMFASDANGSIEHGGGTMLLQLDALGSSDSYSLLPGALYRAMPTEQPPRWDGTDIRDVDDVSLVGGDISKPLALLPDGYMNDRFWVGGLSSGAAYFDVQAMSGTGAFLPPIPLHHVQVAMRIAPGNGSATSGVLSGVARTADVVAWFQLWAGTISTTLCAGSAFQSIAAQFEQMSDIMADGTNEPGKQCDGISVGLGFDAVAVQLGKPAATVPIGNPCADGGVSTTSDGG